MNVIGDDPKVTMLWPEGAPGAHGNSPEDCPSLTTYLPPAEQHQGASLLILPGGGYGGLASHEGAGYAAWFAAQGIACHVLQYRLGTQGYRHPSMLQDAARGLRMVRAMAGSDGLDPSRVGVIGSSAGGHLASMLITQFDDGVPDSTDFVERESSRPDFGILCYPVISGVTAVHRRSFENLLGENPSDDALRQVSSEAHVRPDTPPVFVWHTLADEKVPVENSMVFAVSLRQSGIPFELHLYENGRHGVGLPINNPEAPPWDRECLRWLRAHGFLNRA